jgi:hypothetical protein
MSELRRVPKKRLSVGALGLAGLIVLSLVVYFSFAKRIPFVEGYRLDGVFSNTSQLRKGAPVRIAGVDVGKVVEIKKGPGTTAAIEMEFKDAGLPIHEDATLRVRPRLFLEGGFYIELRAGSPSAPVLPDHGTIPLGQTSVPVQFDQVLTSLDRPTRESLRRTVANLAQGTDKGAAQALGRCRRSPARWPPTTGSWGSWSPPWTRRAARWPPSRRTCGPGSRKRTGWPAPPSRSCGGSTPGFRHWSASPRPCARACRGRRRRCGTSRPCSRRCVRSWAGPSCRRC